MNAELIKRIDVELTSLDISDTDRELFTNCKAEIEAQAERIKSLEGEKISLRYELDVLNESDAGTIQQLQAELAKAREYVPIKSGDICDVRGRPYLFSMDANDRNLQDALIARAGLVVKENV